MSGFVAGPDHAGVRLDVALAAYLGVSRSRAAARIAAGEVAVDGAAATKQHRLRPGERVDVAEPEPVAPRPPPPPPPVRHEDDHLAVVAKPAGLVVHPGPGHPDDTLVQSLQTAGMPLAPAGGPQRPGIVHRLDRDTSGLMVVAKTDAAHAGLVAALRSRAVTRRYLALVEGRPRAPRGRIEAPIGRDPRDRVRFAVVAGGRPAVTRYEVLDVGAAATGPEGRDAREVALVVCRLETGRTHQVRIHLSSLGHPVVGDPVYRASPRVAEALGLRRPALHAAHLAFDHPVTGERVSVDEPPPDDLVAACVRAGVRLPVTTGGA